MPDVSIIIVSYKGHDRLRECLESINKFSGRSLSVEVIIVNNCPGDDKIPLFVKQFPAFSFINNETNGGYANGCNKGASYAIGKYLLILNPDTIVKERAVEELVTTAKLNPSFMITSCRQINENGRETIAWGPFPGFSNLTGFIRSIFRTGYKSQIRFKDNFPAHLFFPDWISGSIVLISRNDFISLKGMDEDFWMYFEDVDLCKRASDIGGKIVFCNNITIEHNHGGSSRINKSTASLTKAEVQISKHIYFSKHESGIKKLLIQTFLVVNNLISVGLIALAGIIFFFIPKLFLRTLIYQKILQYYIGSLLNGSWTSPRSVKSNKYLSERR